MGDVIQFKLKKTVQPSSDNRTDLDDRMMRIRSSLEKINRLMSELKKMNAEGTNVDDSKNRY
jgi:hypothetical protein